MGQKKIIKRWISLSNSFQQSETSARVLSFSVKSKVASKILGVLAMSSFLGKVQISKQVAQHSVHPTGGSLRVFGQFAWLGAGSGKTVLSRPAHQRVTRAVGHWSLDVDFIQKQRRAKIVREGRMIIYTLEVFLIGGPVTEEFAKKNPVVSRTIEIRGDQSLADLHDAIFRAFNREEEHLFEFQIGGKGPNDPKARKYGLVIPDDDIFGGYEESDVTDTTIDSLKLKKNQSFGYWFDFGDDWWHQIDVISIEQKDSKRKYPRISKRVGQSPPQYVDFEE